MLWFSILILTVLVMILLSVVVAAARALAALRKGRMLASCHGYGSEAMSQTGVSVVVSGVRTVSEIEQRLSSEYWRYEVIVVVDSTRDTTLLRALCQKYALIRVSFPMVEELPIEGVPLLYRSRQRRYRRLVVIDRLHRSRADDWNCGVVVASFDRIVPLEYDRFLLPDALPRWVMELHESGRERNEVLSAQVAPMHFFDRRRVAMFARWAVIGEGGFAGEHPRVAMIRRLRGRQLALPLAYSTAYRHRSENPLRRLLIAMGALPTVVLFVALVRQDWEVARGSLLLIVATYATALLASSIALRTRLVVRGEEGEACKKSLRRLLRCSFRIF
jgi:hypothetical protein